MEVDRPGPERVGELRPRIESGAVGPAVVLGQQPRFRRVVARGVEKRMRHVRLKAHDVGAVGLLWRVEHRLLGMHASPADLSFLRQALAAVRGDVAGAREGVRD